MQFLTLLSLLHVVSVSARGWNYSLDGCEALSSVLPNNTFSPSASTYNASILSYPFLQLRLHPYCIFRPSSAEDVATAVNVLKYSNHTKFAIKGGGHNANAGYNNIQDGVTIDMQSLKKVEVARGDQIIRVGAGALWQDVYDEAEKRNLTALGGRIGVVGTAGFLTGGTSKLLTPLSYDLGILIDASKAVYPSLVRKKDGLATMS